METVVRDVRYVYDFFVLSFLVQGRVEQLDERLDDHGEVVFFVVPAAIDLKTKKEKNKTINDGIRGGGGSRSGLYRNLKHSLKPVRRSGSPGPVA